MGSKGPAVLIGTGDAWGESINLQDTDVLYMVMLPWTPKQIRQWEGRVARIGQTRPVLIVYIIAETTVDEDVADNLLGKLPPVLDVVQDSEFDGLEGVFRPPSTESLLDRISK